MIFATAPFFLPNPPKKSGRTHDIDKNCRDLNLSTPPIGLLNIDDLFSFT